MDEMPKSAPMPIEIPGIATRSSGVTAKTSVKSITSMAFGTSLDANYHTLVEMNSDCGSAVVRSDAANGRNL
jgi:hypothetical protein